MMPPVTPPEAPSGSPLLSIDGHVARIVLQRPEQHNALQADDIAQFRSHLATVDTDEDVRVLIVTGSGESTFCAGASLGQIETGEMSGAVFETLTDRLAALRVPTICALNGDIYGGGTEIALCCDFRIGVRDSRMSVPAARLGICYPLGGLRRYVETLGLGVARRVMLGGEELDAEEMLRVGFVDRLVSPGELETATDELAAHLAGLAPLAVQAMKRLLSDVARNSVDEAHVRELIASCSESVDHQEGLTARREGRVPKFHGR